MRFLETLAAIVPAANADAQRSVVHLLEELPDLQEQMVATACARIVLALPDQAWSEETASRIAERADAHHTSLRLSMLGVAARFDDSIKTRLLTEAGDGSFDALDALGDVRGLPSKVVTPLVDVLTRQVTAQIQDAHSGKFSFGTHNLGRSLALLDAWHPHAAKWDPLLELLSDDAVGSGDKRGALDVLASLADRVPDNSRERLRTIAAHIAEQSPPAMPFPPDDQHSAGGPAADLEAALDPSDVERSDGRLLDLLSGDSYERRWAARLAGRLKRAEHIGVLLTLAQDWDPTVRATAAAGLASMVVSDVGGRVAITGMRMCLDDPGTLVPASIGRTFLGDSNITADVRQALEHLRNHASAGVRATARRALERSDI